jgi:hypothetical protein
MMRDKTALALPLFTLKSLTMSDDKIAEEYGMWSLII